MDAVFNFALKWSTYYKALVCVPSNRQEEYEEFSQKVKEAYEDSKQRYGAIKICHTLNGSGIPCSIKRVQRHMAEQGLRSVVVKKYNHHANHGTVPDGKENILKRDFGTETINQKWCTDITYIHVQKTGQQKVDKQNRKQWKCHTADSTDWNSKEKAKMWRKDLADTINATNEQLGIAVYWEHRSFKEQGIDREPTILSILGRLQTL